MVGASAAVAIGDTAALSRIAVGTVALYLLVEGATVAVDRFLALARHYDVSDALVGTFVVSFGTSLPEIGAHVIASLGILSGTLDYTVASGTVVGSNMGSSTAQQLLLFGLFFVGYGRHTLSRAFLWSTYGPMVASFALLVAVAFDGTISRLDGGLLLVSFLGYAYYSFSRSIRTPVLPEGPPESRHVRRDAVVAAGALALVLVSAFVVLAVVEDLVAQFRLSGSMVGVLSIGLAAALPELSTVLESIRRRTPSLALGTLVGSNVVNPLVGIGLGGVVSTYAVPDAVVLWDLPFKLVVGLGLLGYLRYVTHGSLGRRDGVALVLLYVVYIAGRLVVFL